MPELHTYAMTANSGERGELQAATSTPTSRQGDIPADTFAVRLVLARYHAGRLSIEKAAAKCGLNSGNWVRWEDGALPRDKVDVAQAIADGLGIDFDWLLLGGPLLSSRGRPTRRVGAVTSGYRTVAEWMIGDGPSRRPSTGTSTPTGRRPRIIDRDLRAAA
jgi:transcriptional regulator with XRE-family HTH domain